jgi:ubiquinone/menaquinone biosynthesis C-methylase UbiE
MDQKDALRDGYSRSAPVYDQTAGMSYVKALWRLLPRVSVGPQPAILDVGCGTGINLLEAARTLGPCRTLMGVDLSPGMIEVAKRKAASAGVAASFTVGDAESLAAADGSFDLVIGNSVYHWFADRRRTAAELFRVLRPGGQIVLACVAHPGFGEWVRIVDEVRARQLGKGASGSWMPALPTSSELYENLAAAGFTVEHMSYELDAMPVMDVPAFLQTMSVIAPTWLSGVTESARRNFMGSVAEAMVKKSPPTGFSVTTAGMGAVARRPRLPC